MVSDSFFGEDIPPFARDEYFCGDIDRACYRLFGHSYHVCGTHLGKEIPADSLRRHGGITDRPVPDRFGHRFSASG